MVINKIKTDRMDAKRNSNVQIDISLTTIISEIQRTQIRPSDIPTDEQCIEVMLKYVKNLTEMINITTDNSDLHFERNLINKYLPIELTEKELQSIIGEIIIEIDAKSMKDMGKVMKTLKSNITSPYNGGIASNIVRELLK